MKWLFLEHFSYNFTNLSMHFEESNYPHTVNS
jgi:hypothetical protein